MRQLDFLVDAAGEAPLAGHFFTLRITNSISPLLRRPFAFSGFDPASGRASCIYQVRGNGTELLATLGERAPLDIIGPLGRPFPLPAPGEQPVLVAGGIGLGPILFLSRALASAGIVSPFIFGCRSAAFFPQRAFYGIPVTVCTDDGSLGFRGTVADYLKSISTGLPARTVLYCCGPHPMLRGCHDFALQRSIRCIVSVEQTMACGVGACMGCAVRMRGSTPYARACKEGPVFESGDLLWD